MAEEIQENPKANQGQVLSLNPCPNGAHLAPKAPMSPRAALISQALCRDGGAELMKTPSFTAVS